MSKVTVTVSGPVGSGKSAVCGEIEILCKALGLQVEWVNGQEEKNLTHADWTEALEMYKPEVTIVEKHGDPMMALHKELGQMRWTGADEGWDRAIEAVRVRINEIVAASDSADKEQP